MLLRNSPKASPTTSVARIEDVARAHPDEATAPSKMSEVADTSVQGDVGRLLTTAAELFALIEAEIRGIEGALTTTTQQRSRSATAAGVKEEILRSAANLDTSLRSIRDHLGHRIVELARE